MTQSQTLDAMLQHLPVNLYTPEDRQRLMQLGALLPPVDRGGFEYRLNSGSPELDVQLCILPDEFPLVRKHMLSQRPEFSDAHPKIPTLLALLGWAEASTSLTEMWMEFDTGSDPGSINGLPCPSVFFGFEQRPADQAAQVMDALHICFQDDHRGSMFGAVQQCLAACNGDMFVSHLGFMLPRQEAGCRLIVKRLTAETVAPFLECFGGGIAAKSNALPLSLRSVLARAEHRSPWTIAKDRVRMQYG